MSKPRFFYGAKPSPFDPRDFKYCRLSTPAARPKAASVERAGEPVLDQGQEGSCVFNAMAGAIEHLVPGFIASRSFTYYTYRSSIHDLKDDTGADPRAALEVVRKHGAPPESDWAYDGLDPSVSKTFRRRPTPKIKTEAKKLVLEEYQALGQVSGILNDICDCIANTKLPVMIGIAVYDSFESNAVAANGHVPMPKASESLLGYHEILAEAYDDGSKLLKCRNSWSTSWGDGGFFYLPYAYASNIKLLTDANVVTKAHLQ
jgi:C1A family cysteine protease